MLPLYPQRHHPGATELGALGGVAVAGTRGGEHGESSGPAGRPGSPLMARQRGLPAGGHDLVTVNIIFPLEPSRQHC